MTVDGSCMPGAPSSANADDTSSRIAAATLREFSRIFITLGNKETASRLPVGERAVRPSLGHPWGSLGHRLDKGELLFIDADAQAWTVVWPHLAVPALEELWHVRHGTLTLVVLHQHLTRKRHHRLHVAGRRDGAGEMRHDAYLVGVAHRHDLEHLGDATDVGQRRAREIDVALLNQWTELRPCPPLLAWRERHRRQQSQLRDLCPELLLAHGILNAERPRWLHETTDFHGF